MSDYRVGFDVREGHGGYLYWMEVDGVSNENHGWGSVRTEGGYGFVIPYQADDAGTEHDYRVSVSRFGSDNAHCEIAGTFRVKGG